MEMSRKTNPGFQYVPRICRILCFPCSFFLKLSHPFQWRFFLCFSQLTKKTYKQLERRTRILRFSLPFPIFAYPFYLVMLSYPFFHSIRSSKLDRMFIIFVFQMWRSPGKEGSHFNPYSDIFAPNERKDIVISTSCWTLMAVLLVYLSFVFGPTQIFKLYGVPYWVITSHFLSPFLAEIKEHASIEIVGPFSLFFHIKKFHFCRFSHMEQLIKSIK